MRPTFLLLFVFIAACAPMAEIDLGIIDPAEYTFPVHVQQLAFINRGIDLPILKNDTVKWTSEEHTMLNKLVSRWTFEGVREALVNSPMYLIDTIKVLNFRRNENDSTQAPLSYKEISYLNKIHPADALISLEKFTLSDSSSAEDIKTSESYVVYSTLVTKAFWRIYDVSNGSVLDEYKHADTSVWRYYKTADTADDEPRLTSLGRAIRTESYNGGIIYGNRISPAWIQVPRYYYRNGGGKMRKAARKAAKNDWDGAAEIWKKLAYQEKQETAAQACFNMALVCEMEDLMVPAMDWANKSMSLQADTLTRDYIKILNKRTEQFDKLEKQVPDTENSQ